MRARAGASSLFLTFTLLTWSAPVGAVTITFTEIVSSAQGEERPIDVTVSVDVAQCQPPETVVTAPPCVRRTLRNPEFGFVELSVSPGALPAASDANPARALLLEPDERTISDRLTLTVIPAEPTGFPRDTVNIRFDSDPIEAALGATPGGLRFFAVETDGREVDLTSKFFTGTGTNLTDEYKLPPGFVIKAQSDIDPVAEPMTLVLLASGLAGLGGVVLKHHRRR
jgi:hypothetical protein